MRNKSVFLLLPLLTALVACGGPGYYDANGNYVAPAYAERHPVPGATTYHYPAAHTTVVYLRPGYYDYYGNYISTVNERTAVPPSMMPPQGMCRIWLPDQDIQYQPGIEDCTGIQNRVPKGAYVIYGG